ncbi:MAG TPA: hypothetical protein VFH92_10195 [Phenylobacterium sp.]|nr:hypothetical protein [Phenylobacterium sp.]
MPELAPGFETDRPTDRHAVLHFTPSEWRSILQDPDFLRDRDNDYRSPRRWLGVEVRIVPDHRFG